MEEKDKNIGDGADKAKDLKQELKDTLFATRDIAEEAKNIAIALGMGSIEAASFRKAFKDTASVSQDLIDNAEKLSEGTIGVKDIQKEIEKNDKSQLGLKREIEQVLLKAGVNENDISKAIKEQDGLTNLLYNKHNDINSKIVDAVTLYEEQLENNTKNNKELNTQLDKSKKIKDTVGLSGKLLEGIGKIPIAGQLIDSKEALTKMNKAAGKGASSMKTMMVGLKSATTDLLKGALNPLTIAIAALKAGLAFDKQITDLQKGMGISESKAYGLRMEMTKAAAASDDMAINSERLLKTFSMLQSQLGIAATFSTEMTEDATVLSEKLGLSEKATANFAKSSLVVGKSIDEQYKSSLGIINSIQVQTGAMIPFKETLEKAGNVTGQIRAQLGGSLEEITKAVGVAASLGMELEQVAKSGESMLNFQSSIEAELEAELLTGKELNLEKARLLALTGDYEGLAKEISKEAGNFTEFSKMNVLQQNALAKSLGMSSNEMSDMLMKEEMIGQTKESALAAGNEDLAKRIEARDVQEQMADAVAKLKGVFVDLVGGPVGAFLNLLTLALTPIGIMMEGLSGILNMFGESEKPMTKMEAILGSMAAIYLGIKATQIASNALAGIRLAFAMRHKSALVTNNALERKGLGSTVARAAGAIFRALSAMGPIGVGLSIAAVAGMAALVYGLSNRKAEKGGMIGGNRHSSGGTIIEAEQGEFIMSRQGVQSVGVENLHSMNTGGKGYAKDGGVVGGGPDMQGFTDAVVSAVSNTQPGTVVASPFGLNDANYQSRNGNFNTSFE